MGKIIERVRWREQEAAARRIARAWQEERPAPGMIMYAPSESSLPTSFLGISRFFTRARKGGAP